MKTIDHQQIVDWFERTHDDTVLAELGIEVSFDPTGKGSQKKRIDVYTNAAPQSLIQLTISADIQPFVALQPEYLLFRTVESRAEARKTA